MTFELEHRYHRIIALTQQGGAEEAYELCRTLPPASDGAPLLISSALIETGVALETAGETAKAAELYKQLAHDDGTIAAIRANGAYRLGFVLERQGLLFSSRDAFEIAAMQTDEPLIRRTAMFHLASSLADAGEYAGACTWLEQLLTLPGEQPSPFAAELKLIHCRAGQGVLPEEVPWPERPLDALEAATWLEAALSLERAGDDETSARMMRRLLDSSPASEAGEGAIEAASGESLWHLANVLLARDKAKASELAPKLLALAETDARPVLLGLKGVECLAWTPGRLVEAADVAEALARVPGHLDEATANAAMSAGFALEQAGHQEAARTVYRELLTREGVPGPVATNVHFRLGVIADATMDWDTATAEYERAVASPHEFGTARADAAFRLASTKMLMEDYAGAEAVFESLRLDSRLPRGRRTGAQLQQAQCRARSGDIAGAVALLGPCRDPGFAGAENAVRADVALGEIFEARREFARARECYERVMSSTAADPLTRTAALTKVQQLGRKR